MATFEEEKTGKFISINMQRILTCDNLKSEELISFMTAFESFVKEDGKYISNGQVRVLFDLISKTGDINELQLVRPQIAFVAAKQITDKRKFLIEKFLLLIASANTKNHHDNIKKFITSFLHYHKFYHSDKK